MFSRESSVLTACRGSGQSTPSRNASSDVSFTAWVFGFAFIVASYLGTRTWYFLACIVLYSFTAASGTCIGAAMAVSSRRATQVSGTRSEVLMQ